MSIPLATNEMFYKYYKSEIDNSIQSVLNSGEFILGKNVLKFEKEFAKYCGSLYCLGVANGSDALTLSLIALGVKKGDDVLCVANAGFYSSAAILSIGAIPNYVDIRWETMNMDPNLIEQSINGRTKAIIVTHLYGLISDMDLFVKVSREKNIPIIEDSAQAHGAEINQKKAGNWGSIGTFSFYPTKNLGALGDGGAIITSDINIYNKVRQLREYGWKKKYIIGPLLGKNSRLDELQAAILLVKLKYLDEMNSKRINIANIYKNEIKNSAIRLPDFTGNQYVAHLFVIRTINRKNLISEFIKNNISYEIHYAILDNEQEYFQNPKIDYYSADLKQSKKCNLQVLTIPCHPFLQKKEIDNITKLLNNF